MNSLKLLADEHFAWDEPSQGLKSLRENLVLEGHGFSRAVNC